jgi:RNA polymerase sigma-70 factor (ECF subfamily)
MGDFLSQRRIHQTNKRSDLRVVPGWSGAQIDLLVKEALTSPEALEKLCGHYIPRIYNYVLKRVGSVQDAEDITSMVFEKAITNLDSFDDSKASFSTWIYRIATNCITDHYRSRGRKRESPLEDEVLPVTAPGDPGLDKLDLYLGLLDLLQQLPVKYREALALRYFGHMRVSEVAETLRITESAASKRILRGLEELRRQAADGPLQELI